MLQFVSSYAGMDVMLCGVCRRLPAAVGLVSAGGQPASVYRPGEGGVACRVNSRRLTTALSLQTAVAVSCRVDELR